MNLNNLDLFIKAAEEIFIEIGFSNLKINKSNNNNPKFDIIANIGITGEISGFLLIRSDMKSCMAFVNKMLENMGMENDESEFGQFHKEAFGEILNQISGRAVMLLEAEGIDSDITPPTILKGSNISMGTYTEAEMVHRTIEGSFGNFDLLVGAKK
ncbi:MAG: chemotaxis protein CheX [Bacteroidetes bacterium]|nr:MAG: chemotaxis protein CheX [Bacteroidota bacterium]